MRYHWEKLPTTLQVQRDVLHHIIEAFACVRPVQRVILFGSYARGEAGQDSDIDLCIVAEETEEQIRAAIAFREAIYPLDHLPALTLLPITPQRLQQKIERHDPVFEDILGEGIVVASN